MEQVLDKLKIMSADIIMTLEISDDLIIKEIKRSNEIDLIIKSVLADDYVLYVGHVCASI